LLAFRQFLAMPIGWGRAPNSVHPLNARRRNLRHAVRANRTNGALAIGLETP
jgi:hypothetical protein